MNTALTIIQQCQLLLSTTSTGPTLVTEMSQYIDQRADYIADDYYSGTLSDEDDAEFDAQVTMLKVLRAECLAWSTPS
jgi:hypothetical protein